MQPVRRAAQAALRGLLPARRAASAATATAASGPRVVVEYCVRCNYAPRYELLRSKLAAAFPGLQVEADTSDRRQGAFEVTLLPGSSSGGHESSSGAGGGGGNAEEQSRRRQRRQQQPLELWSKLLTGEPSNLEATEKVAELVVRELEAALR